MSCLEDSVCLLFNPRYLFSPLPASPDTCVSASLTCVRRVKSQTNFIRCSRKILELCREMLEKETGVHGGKGVERRRVGDVERKVRRRYDERLNGGVVASV